MGSPAEGDEVALVNCVDDVSSESEDEVRVKAATVNRSSDADEDSEALRPDARDAMDEGDDTLIVEFEKRLSDASTDAGITLLPGTLVGAGEGVTDPGVIAAARAEAGDANGYGGTIKSLGNGGTEGTTGRTTVGTAGTDGTCGKEGTAGTGTEGGTAAAGDARDSAAFTTADAAEFTALAAAGTTAVFVSWPTRFPLASTVAMTSTATVKTFVAGAAWRR